MSIVQSIQEVLTRVYKTIKPETLIQWMIRHYWLSATSTNSQGERFVPRGFQIPFLYLMWDLDIPKIVLIKGVQQGASQCANGFLLYEPIHRHRNIIYYTPDDGGVQEFSTTNLAANIADMPVVREAMIADPDNARHDSDNTSSRKGFHGGQLHVKSSRKPKNFTATPAASFVFDETDRALQAIKVDAKQEGVSPLDLAWGRVAGAQHKKGIFLSTATEEGTSNIMYVGQQCEAYMVYFHECPHCGHFQELLWTEDKTGHGFKWDTIQDSRGRRDNAASAETVRYVCESKGCEFTHADFKKIDKDPSKQYLRQKIVDWDDPRKFEYGNLTLHWDADYKFTWKRHGQPTIAKPKSVFLQWRSWFSKETSWAEGAEMFLNGVDRIREGNPSPLRRWTQEYKSEVWREQGSERKIRHGYFMARQAAENLSSKVVPEKVQIVMHTADVQKDRVEVLVTGWGYENEVWLLDKYVIFGDITVDRQPLIRYQEMTTMLYQKANGVEVPVYLSAIDAKYQTDIVLEACEGDWKDSIIPMIGTSALRKPLVIGRPKTDKQFDCYYTSLCTDNGKDRIYQMYQVESPGPGYVHISNSEKFDEATIKQLVSEHKVKKGQNRQWEKITEGALNEMFDMLYIALALVEFAKVQYGLELVPFEKFDESVYDSAVVSTPDDYAEIASAWS